MEAKINLKKFLEEIEKVKNVIDKNKIRPIIEAVKITAEDNKIILEGTDLEAYINTTIEAKIKTNGKIAVQPEIFEYLSLSDSEEIILELKNGTLTIRDGENTSEHTILDETEFPQIKYSLKEKHEIKTDLLINSLEKTMFGAEQKGERPALHCIRIEAENKKISFISSDTFKMVFLEKIHDREITIKISLPLKSAKTLLKLLKTIKEDEVYISSEESKAVFLVGNTIFSTRLIDLPFPNWKSILSSFNSKTNTEFRKNNLKNALEKSLFFSKENSNAVNSVTFNIENTKTEIKAMNEKAKSKEKLQNIKTGTDLKISLNAKFIVEFLKQIDGDKIIKMNFGNSNEPFLIEAETSEDYKMLCMPFAVVEN